VRSLIAMTIFVGSFLIGAFLIGLGVFIGGISQSEIIPSTRADGIVVLTGGAQRISDATDLLASGKGKRLLISGVNPRNTQEEIVKATPDLKAWYSCCVDLDYLARNTIGNAIETRKWVRQNRFSSLIVVTSNYHMPRALLELSHALPNVQLVPFSVIPEPNKDSFLGPSMGRARLFLIEYVKFMLAKARMVFETDPETSYVAYLASGGRKPIYDVPLKP
jgi:uncharacterized SAM-binding protein YcdF (DUF218 family)